MASVVPLKKRRYDGASTSTRTRQWNTPSTDADSANSSPARLRNRARDLRRNNPWAAKGIQVITNNVIGYGIKAQWKSKKAQRLWSEWAETSACDASGMQDIYGLQSLALSCVVESGEVLVRLRPRLASDGLPVPMQIQVLDPDRLVETLDGQTRSGNLVSRGIEYDAVGRRVAYYLYKHHPGAVARGLRTDWNQYSRVPASEIIHVFRKDRPEQERGVTWLAPIIMTLRELDIYEDAYLKRQQIANLFALFVLSQEENDTAQQAFTDLEDGLMPGAAYFMQEGFDVKFSAPPKADDYGPYTRDTLYRAAAGLGVTSEALTGDLSRVNFSSARMGWQEFGRNIDAWRWQMFIPTFCHGVARWFIAMSDVTDKPPEWTPPARTLVDPAKEIPALRDAVRSGFKSWPEAVREQGFDPDQLMDEIKQSNDALDRLGIKLDSDPRANAKTAEPDTEEPNDDE